MDSDIHVQEPHDLWARYIEPRFKERAPQYTNIPDGSSPGVWRFEGKVFPAYIDRPERQRLAKVRRRKAHHRHEKLGREVGPEEERRGEDPQAMLHAMDVEGIDVSIVFRTRAAHVIAGTNRARLKPAALLPVHDVKLAAAEARRSVKELGAVVLVLPNQQVNGRPWYDCYYDPLWAEAERLHVPVAFHGIQLAYQEHLGRRYLDNFAMAHAMGHPVEMMLALGSMLTGGVFERFPGLTAAFLEGNCSWVPWWLWCLDERVEKFGDDERFPLKMPPSEYFRRHCYVSVDPDEAVVRYTIEAIGDENIVISTDWPHDDSAYPHAIETFLQLDGVSEASKRKILWDNCARLYGIE
jgi:predicted TIM-barrel fold metal-dependent hydrolase